MKKAILVVFMLLCSAVAGSGALAQQGDRYGPVQPNETLYRIALEFRQPGVSVAQMMLAIFEANPGAFDRGNINRLKVGSLLDIPGPGVAKTIDRGAAKNEVEAQIDSYEREIRESKAQREQAESTDQAPRAAELETGAAVDSAVAAPDSEQIEEIKEELAVEQQQTGQILLPEPKPPKRKKRQRSEAPVFRYSYDISIIDDDNVRLAEDDDDIREDVIFSPTIKARAARTIDSFTIWDYGGSATYNKYDTFDELDNFEFEINTRYRFALSSGFTSPIYSLKAKIGGAEYESEMRDATRLSLSADLNKWITNTVNMTTGIEVRGQESKSDVYDTSEARLFVNFDTELTKSDLVYTTLSFISGDIVSSATPSLAIINAAEEIEPDDAFGGIEANQFAYRLDAETWVVTLGYNRIMTRSLSLDLSARFVDSEATEDDSLGYERTILRASLLGRF